MALEVKRHCIRSSCSLHIHSLHYSLIIKGHSNESFDATCRNILCSASFFFY